MKSKLINALESICPDNVFLQGTLAENAPYPDEFITFWTNATPDNSHYDDDTLSWDWNFSVIYYSNDPTSVGEKPKQIIAALKAAGFKPQGKGSDIPSDVQSHTGWAMDFIATEYKQ